MRPALALLTAALLAPAGTFAGKVPPPPNDQFFFVDQKSFDKIESLAHIDEEFQEFCLAGSAVFIDASNTLNRRIQIDFSSLGTISNESPSGGRIDGDFTTVDLTLTITDGPTTDFPVIFGPTTITPPCKLDGSLQQFGDRLRANLSCEVGTDLADFDIPESVPDPFGGPAITQQSLLDSIVFATAKKKTIKVNLKKGTIDIHTLGITNQNSDTSLLTCPTSSDD